MSSSAFFNIPALPASASAGASTPVFVRAGARRFSLGSDISGVTDVDAALTTVSGRTALAQRILRRLSTPRGGLIGSQTYGYDVTALIGSTVPASVVEQRVLEQALAEEEVDDAQCVVTSNDAAGELTVELRVVDAEGPFGLVLTASELTVSVLIDGQPLFGEVA